MLLKFLRSLLSLGTNVMAAVVLLLLLSASGIGDRLLAGFRVALFPPSEAKVDVRSTVLQQIRGASELTTAVFGMESVVPTSRDRTLAGYTVGQTTLLYIAYGEVRAGVDLNQLQPSDITIQDETVTIRLPEPQILDSKIDVTRSQVYDYDRGFLSLGPDAAPELQTLAQQESLNKMIDAACQQAILAEANTKAELVVQQLLETAGFAEVIVQPRSLANLGCSAQLAQVNAAAPF